jgi:hypothetical protein
MNRLEKDHLYRSADGYFVHPSQGGVYNSAGRRLNIDDEQKWVPVFKNGDSTLCRRRAADPHKYNITNRGPLGGALGYNSGATEAKMVEYVDRMRMGKGKPSAGKDGNRKGLPPWRQGTGDHSKGPSPDGKDSKESPPDTTPYYPGNMAAGKGRYAPVHGKVKGKGIWDDRADQGEEKGKGPPVKGKDSTTDLPDPKGKDKGQAETKGQQTAPDSGQGPANDGQSDSSMPELGPGLPPLPKGKKGKDKGGYEPAPKGSGFFDGPGPKGGGQGPKGKGKDKGDQSKGWESKDKGKGKKDSSEPPRKSARMTPDEKRENALRLGLREPLVGVGVTFDEDPTNGRCVVINSAEGPWFFPDGELLFDALPRTKKDDLKELVEELYDGYLFDTRRVADDNRLLHRSRPAAFEYADGMISQMQRTCPHEDVSRLYIQKCAILLTGVPVLRAPYNSSAYMGPRAYQEFGVGPEAQYDTPDVFKCFDLQGSKLLADVKSAASKSAWVAKILPHARYLALGETYAENLGWMIPASRHYPPTAWCGSPNQHVAQQQLLDMSTHGRLGGQAGFNCQAAWMLSLTSATERYRTVTRMMTVQGNPDVEVDGPSGAALLSPIHPITNADWEMWKVGVCRLMYSPATQCHSGTIREPEPKDMAPHASRDGESYFGAVHVYVSYKELAHMLWVQFELAGIYSIPVWLGGGEDPLVGAERPRDDDLYQAMPDTGTYPTMCGVAVPLVHPSHFESGA